MNRYESAIAKRKCDFRFAPFFNGKGFLKMTGHPARRETPNISAFPAPNIL
jgi:hypothetical protein